MQKLITLLILDFCMAWHTGFQVVLDPSTVLCVERFHNFALLIYVWEKCMVWSTFD